MRETGRSQFLTATTTITTTTITTTIMAG